MTDTRDATSKPQSTSHANGSSEQPSKTDTPSSVGQAVFITMALSMSWQLAVVVLVPIIGGHLLDGHYHTDPWLTLVGLIIAFGGVFGVLVRTVAAANARAAHSSESRGKDK